MQKRLIGVLVGIALLTTLCVNVLAVYADDSPHASTTESSVLLSSEGIQTETSDTNSAPTIFETAIKALSLDASQNDSTPPEDTGPVLIVNGVSVSNTGAHTVNGTTYLSIRAILSALDPAVSIAWQDGQLVATGNGFHLTARPGEPFMVVNERYLYVPDSILLHDDTTKAPVRTICTALGASTNWDPVTKNITVTTTGSPLISGDSYYNSDDLYWMSRIISAESKNQPINGMIGVGTVIMNRVESPKFPDSIYDVIFSGTQFSPVKNGSIYSKPTDNSVIAAKLVLEGAREAGDSLFFNRTGLDSWASRNKDYITTIADHSFYL